MDTNPTATQPASPNYVSALLMPRTESKADRRVWSVPLLGVWVPFFTATNAAGETDIAPDVLGAPVRLQKSQDGTPKFSKSGRPVLRTAKELSDQIKLVRENFTFGLLSYAENVRKAMPAEFKAQVEAAEKAGAPIIRGDADAVTLYLEELKEQQAPHAGEAEHAGKTGGTEQAHAEPAEHAEQASPPSQPSQPARTSTRHHKDKELVAA